jgi:hypothetical protein
MAEKDVDEVINEDNCEAAALSALNFRSPYEIMEQQWVLRE